MAHCLQRAVRIPLCVALLSLIIVTFFTGPIRAQEKTPATAAEQPVETARSAPASSSAGRVFYVAPYGSDDAPGTREQPWATPAKAGREARAGDTVIFLPGTYAGVLQPVSSGTPDAPIRFVAAKRRTARLTGLPGTEAIRIIGVSHIYIEGFHLRPEANVEGSLLIHNAAHPTQGNPMARTVGSWMRIQDASHIYVNDVLMEETPVSNPFSITGSEHIYVRDSVMRGNTHNMVVIGSSRRVLFEGNAISQAGHSPFRFYPSGSNEFIVIRGNVFHAGWSRNFELFTPRNVLFERNVITSAVNGGRSNSTNAKLAMTGGIFRFNAVYRNWGGPLHVHGEDGHHADVKNMRLYHNVFYDNAEYGFSISREEARDIVFVNNIWAENDRNGGNVQVHMLGGRKADHVRFLHNAFFASSGTATIAYGNMAYRISQVEAPTWRQLNGEQFAGNVESDPSFEPLHQYSFSLRPDSPLIDAGTPLTYAIGDGTGDRLPVADARYFYDGFGLIGEVGDLIAVRYPGQTARIVAVDYENNVLTLDRPVTWADGDPVSLPWSGDAPDIGLYEHGDGGVASVQILTVPFAASPGEPVELRLVLHNVPEPVRAVWHLGDGTRTEGLQIVHAYTASGEYPIRVQVTDAHGMRHRAAALVVIDEPRDESDPLLLSTFDADDEAWWRTWKTYRPAPADYRRILDPESGEGVLHVFAPEPGGKLPASVSPANWDIDAYPIVEMRYRVDPGVSVGVFIEAFRTADRTRRIQLGTLTADGNWHEMRVDVRLIRVLYRDVSVLQALHLEALRPPEVGAGYWLDWVIIRPEG